MHKMPEWRHPVAVSKEAALYDEFPVVFAASRPTLQQVHPSSEHAVRWQLAPVVARLGNIALKVRLTLSYERQTPCEVYRESLGVTRMGGDLWDSCA